LRAPGRASLSAPAEVVEAVRISWSTSGASPSGPAGTCGAQELAGSQAGGAPAGNGWKSIGLFESVEDIIVDGFVASKSGSSRTRQSAETGPFLHLGAGLGWACALARREGLFVDSFSIQIPCHLSGLPNRLHLLARYLSL